MKLYKLINLKKLYDRVYKFDSFLFIFNLQQDKFNFIKSFICCI